MRLKTFCEFIIPDLHTNRCGYRRFDALVEMLSGEYEFDTLALFKEIVGKRKKYLTYNRIKRVFKLYRDNSKSISNELKNFLSFMFNTVVKVTSLNLD